MTAEEIAVRGGGSYRHQLTTRHISMIALGGAIGTGLFYGSSEAIRAAGPSVLLFYLLGGAVIYIVVRALAEMSVHRPTSGAFSEYAYEYWGTTAGFISGWNYWFNYTAVSMVELAVVGTFVNYWFPSVPGWLSALLSLLVIVYVNLRTVKVFGETEYWFALVKVLAVIGMIVVGSVVVAVSMSAGQTGGSAPGLGNLVEHGGFFPNDLSLAATALVPVMFSFGGCELFAVAAGEAKDPVHTIPKAANQILLRVLVFYVLGLGVILSVVPWPEINGEMSPFVQIFEYAGLPGGAHVLNLVVLTAVLSVFNSGLYANGRLLSSLAEQGNAPRWLAAKSRQGVPARAVLVSAAAIGIAVIVVLLWPDMAFPILMSVALAAGLINWTIILITQRRFRSRLSAQEVRTLRYPMPGGAAATYGALGVLGVVVILMAVTDGYRTAVIAGPLWVAGLSVAHWVLKSRQRTRAAAESAGVRSGGSDQHARTLETEVAER